MEKEIALKDLVSDDKKYNAIMHTVRTGMNVCVLGESMTGKSSLMK